MPTNCVFKFDRATPIYYSGEQICGNITLTTSKLLRLEDIKENSLAVLKDIPEIDHQKCFYDCKERWHMCITSGGDYFEAIVINCKGAGEVNWYNNAAQTAHIEYNDSNKDDDRIQHHGNETYINESLRVQERKQLQPGQHEYKFSFSLPTLCPATCIQKYGEVFYSVNLILKRRSKYDKIYEQRFVVKKRLDLNENRYLAQKLDKHTHNGTHFSISRTGFVPGQDIKFSLKVPKCEQTLRDMQKLRVRLCQKYNFKCQQPITYSKDLLRTLDMVKSDISANLFDSFEASLRIPLLTPITSADRGTIISVSYFLEAVILSKHKFVLEKFTIPVTLGTKALKGFDSDSDIELGEFCYDNFRVKSCEESLESTDEPLSFVDTNVTKSLAAVYDHSPLLAKKLRRFTNFNMIRMPVNICTQLLHVL